MKRVMKEVGDLKKMSGVHDIQVHDHHSGLDLVIDGPEGTPYEAGKFAL